MEQLRLILTDFEFQPLAPRLLTIGSKLNAATSQEHVPEVERAIRVVEEKARYFVNTLPFKALAKLLKNHLICYVVQIMNFTVHPNSISPFLSPVTIVTGKQLGLNVHCRVPFGSFCQVPIEHKPLNSISQPRTLDAIALRPTGNHQGGYYFYHITSCDIIARRSWTVVPMSHTIIDLMNVRAMYDEQPHNPVSFVFRRHDWSILTSFDRDDSHLLNTYLDDEGAVGPGATPGALNVPIPDEPVPGANEGAVEGADHALNEGALEDLTPDPNLASEDDAIDETDSSDTELPHPNLRETHDANDELQHNDDVSYSSTNNNDNDSTNTSTNTTPTHDDDEVTSTSSNESTTELPHTDADDPSSQRDSTAKDSIQPDVTADNIIGHEPDDRPSIERYHMRGQVQPEEPSDFSSKYGFAFTQMSAREGLRRFGKLAADALIAEWIQLDRLNVFEGAFFSGVSREFRRKALRLVQLIKKKRCGKMKGRTCANGRKQRSYISKEDAKSPTVTGEGLILSCVTDVHEGRVVVTCDVPGAFLHSDVKETIYVVVDGALVDILIQSNKKYKKYVHITKDGKKLVYLKLRKTLYGTVTAARLFWENITEKLIKYGLELNPYDECVANALINGSQCTIAWHVDDLKISHKDESVINDILTYLSGFYGELSITKGNKHTYVGMDIECPGNGTVEIGMKHYLDEALEAFPDEITGTATSPAAEHLFDVDDTCEPLPESRRKILNSIVAKLLYVATKGRPDLYVPIAFLTSRVSKATTDDWKKLARLLSYIKHTRDLVLTLSAESLNIVKWYVDAAYGVRDDYKSQSGMVMTLGQGVLLGKSVKQKLNAKSSSEAEIIATSDAASQMLWAREFMDCQGYDIDKSILYQDNKSAILLETNGRLSCGKNNKHINIRYFFLKDRVNSGEMDIEYCPTNEMIADFFTKPLQGSKFTKFRDMILDIIPMNEEEILKAQNRSVLK